MKMKVFGLLAILALSAAACGGGKKDEGGTTTPTPTHSGPAPTVVQATDKLTFVPASATVAVGGIVEWRNGGTLPHTVTFSKGGTFDQPLDPGKTVTFTFTTAGTVTYMCKIHPTMKGTVVVS